MPPRIPTVTCLRAAGSFALPLRPFSSTPLREGRPSPRDRKRISQDPYLVAQRNRKKTANLSRRAELDEARVASLGDPVRGNTTPFIESFETGLPVNSAQQNEHESGTVARDSLNLNYALNPSIVKRQLKKSEQLAVPLAEMDTTTTEPAPRPGDYPWSQYNKADPSLGAQSAKKTPAELAARRRTDHTRATEAITRITALENASSKDRMRSNIERCVTAFGRHNTDRILPPRAPPLPFVNSTQPHPVRPKTNEEAAKKRIGPDTGSSEVQISILTAKIKTLADFLATRGKGDKHNKRNLRLLVHRRQKLLQYLRRKERGGPRWEHLIETLGLTEGTWRGEISL
ncbi:hypothetical protein BDV95DRAFT_593210 [Massariosphaeria phaeospora]|uniref:Ribosomal protein S15 n=1 Tax=Massariosphaeria phaeospora TaxID=100035 RepID=A0A7C8I9C0_9PLEO|nr:hypothetical protein BDV95DRAFT_593210 [Massariosphaeria phaeospora]